MGGFWFWSIFSMKLSGCHVERYLSRIECSKKALGPFEKHAFFLTV
jgi:hypothetical protein